MSPLQDILKISVLRTSSVIRQQRAGLPVWLSQVAVRCCLIH